MLLCKAHCMKITLTLWCSWDALLTVFSPVLFTLSNCLLLLATSPFPRPLLETSNPSIPGMFSPLPPHCSRPLSLSLGTSTMGVTWPPPPPISPPFKMAWPPEGTAWTQRKLTGFFTALCTEAYGEGRWSPTATDAHTSQKQQPIRPKSGYCEDHQVLGLFVWALTHVGGFIGSWSFSLCFLQCGFENPCLRGVALGWFVWVLELWWFNRAHGFFFWGALPASWWYLATVTES